MSDFDKKKVAKIVADLISTKPDFEYFLNYPLISRSLKFNNIRKVVEKKMNLKRGDLKPFKEELKKIVKVSDCIMRVIDRKNTRSKLPRRKLTIKKKSKKKSMK